METAGIGGAAHLVNFMGTDTIPAIDLLMNYYGADMCGFSIPASEHSTITSWGIQNEAVAYENMLDKYPKGLVACVSDSWNIWEACSKIWGEKLKDKILARDGTLVVRPDSGEPVEVVLKVLDILGGKFGYDMNDKGYKVLNPHIRAIQGDGVNNESIIDILTEMRKQRWSADNITFGSGGALLQKLDRDTQKFAIKCSEVTVNGITRPVFKCPINEPFKVSKSGRFVLINDNGEYKTLPVDTEGSNILRTVFLNGQLIVDDSLEEIRKRAKEI